MGVPLLLTWLRTSFAKCFFPAEGEMSKSISDSVDNLYIDLNSLLYQSSTIVSVGRGHFRTVEEVEDAVLRKLYDLLDDIIFHLVEPKALVYIAVDGISPLGKMSQQRSRRLRQSERRHQHHGHRRFDNDDARDGNGVMKESMEALWDNNCITVGTRFMTKATEALHAYAVSRTERMNLKRFQEATDAMERGAAANGDMKDAALTFTPLSIVVDDVLRPGEGENKILEVIRRFREQPSYSPNLTHMICSSDTDVTVSSLLLHEPRMFVLRYEPPAGLGGKDPVFAASRAGPSSPGTTDSWLSTFFSIYMFREGLRKLLGLAPIEINLKGDKKESKEKKHHRQSGVAEDFLAAPDVTPEASVAFERALHDVVFVMLLFGNDFLPTLGGSIKEGTLDALLSLLASDFVSRNRTIVDPETNHIHFTSARYLLECLSDIRGQNPNGILSIHGGGGDSRRSQNRHGNHGSNGGGGGSGHGGGGGGMDWGFTDDPEFQQRKLEKEKLIERKCYCYWTMLQWALQYSAGVVDHWGCYYPFPDAPPLHALKKYCGVLSYDALVKFVASRHAAQQAGKDMDEMDLPSSPSNTATTIPGDPTHDRLTSKPTDAMVQLLVLTPQSSSILLPTVFRNAYDEIAAAVLAPVEKLDIGLVERWCDEKKKLLSEEERTRFDAYQLFSSPDPLPSIHERGSGGIVPSEESKELTMTSAAYRKRRTLPANEVTFMAYWDGGVLAEELQDFARRLKEDRIKQEELKLKQQQQQVTASAPAAAAGRAAASFFGSRKPKSAGAAAAALLQAQTAPPRPPPSPLPEVPATPSKELEAVAEKEPDAITTETKEELESAEVTAVAMPAAALPSSASAVLVLVSNTIQSIFFYAGIIEAYLPSDTLVRAMGYLDGPRFVVGGGAAGGPTSGGAAGSGGASAVGGGGTSKYATAGAALSRDGRNHQVRLQWRLATAAPALTEMEPTAVVDGVIVSSTADADIVNPAITIPHALEARTGLLPGYIKPSATMKMSVKDMIATKRAAEKARARGEDPWMALEAKRLRTESAR